MSNTYSALKCVFLTRGICFYGGRPNYWCFFKSTGCCYQGWWKKLKSFILATAWAQLSSFFMLIFKMPLSRPRTRARKNPFFSFQIYTSLDLPMLVSTFLSRWCLCWSFSRCSRQCSALMEKSFCVCCKGLVWPRSSEFSMLTAAADMLNLNQTNHSVAL